MLTTGLFSPVFSFIKEGDLIHKDQRGQILVEFGLVGLLFIGLILFLIILGLWLYNSTQTSQAARLAAHDLAVTGNYNEAQQMAYDHLARTSIAAKTNSVAVYWDGSAAHARVDTEMETFFPGLPKLFNPASPNWTGKVSIIREAETTGEYRFRNPQKFN